MSASEFWNTRYQTDDYIFGTEANDFIKAVTPKAEAGQTAYAPADGEGRNGAYLASIGYQVTSIDVSDLAVAKAVSLAQKTGVIVNAHIGDALSPGLADQQFDLVIVCFMHFMPEDHEKFMDVNKRLVKPGGLFIMEGYTIDQIALSSGGPKKPEMMMSDAGLRKTFADFDILLLQETRRLLSEGPRHQGDAATIQIIARKPA